MAYFRCGSLQVHTPFLHEWNVLSLLGFWFGWFGVFGVVVIVQSWNQQKPLGELWSPINEKKDKPMFWPQENAEQTLLTLVPCKLAPDYQKISNHYLLKPYFSSPSLWLFCYFSSVRYLLLLIFQDFVFSKTASGTRLRDEMANPSFIFTLKLRDLIFWNCSRRKK